MLERCRVGCEVVVLGLQPLVGSAVGVGHDYAGAGLLLSQTNRFML
jgi:hypothetical protein